MAFVRGQRRLSCSSFCGCDQISQELLGDLVVYDFDAWAYHLGDRPSPPQGIIFKFPQEYLARRQITAKIPWDYLSCVRSCRVDTLFELSFKVTAMLCENFVRRTFSSHPHGEVVNYHFTQFVLAHYTLVNQYNWPSKFALWLLPRLPTSHRYVGIYPPEIHRGCILNIFVSIPTDISNCDGKRLRSRVI